MENSYIQAINDVVAKYGEDWADKWVKQRVNFLESRKIKSSGTLASSLEYGIEKDSAAADVSITLSMPDYGRIIEMKNISHDKWGRNAVERVKAWIEKRGIERFEAGFLKGRNLKKLPQDALNQMAWGIMVSRSNGKFRRRRWYNKAKAAGITDLYNQVAAGLLEPVSNSVTQALKSQE